MSNVSTSHNIVKLEKNSKAFTGQRLARVIAKKDKEGNYASPNLIESKCVSLPKIEASQVTETVITALMPHILGMLHDAQDSIIRNVIVSNGATSINDGQISIAACLSEIENESSGRVTSNMLREWFVETYSDAAIEFVANLCKFSNESEEWTEEQVKVVETKVNVLKEMFSGFAGGKYSPDIPKCKAMIRFGEFLGEGNMDDRMIMFVGKANKIKVAKEAELSMDALGF